MMHLSHPDVPVPDPIMEREPVRFPLWLTVLGSQAFALAIDLLSDVEWRTALIGVLATLGPVLWGTEVARGRAWSPASVWRATVTARQDERTTAALEQTYGPVEGSGSAGTVTVRVHPPEGDPPVPFGA